MMKVFNEIWYTPYFAQSAKVSHGLVECMSNILPMTGSGLGPGGKGAGRRLETARLVSQTMDPARNTSQAIDENILYCSQGDRGGKCQGIV